MTIRPEALAVIATRGMRIAFEQERAERNQEFADRLQAFAEEQERLRMQALAAQISTEDMLQALLDQVDPEMREAVEAEIRPFTSIQKDEPA